MFRTRTLSLSVAALALVALAGCGDSDSTLGPTAPAAGSASDDSQPLSRLSEGGTGIATVVHGVPGLTVDVYVNGDLTLPSFEPGTVTDPLELPEGTYDLAILPEGGVFPDDAVLTGSTDLPAGANASIVAHLTEAGAPTLSVFVNDLSPTRGIRTRVVVRHLAAAPTVDVRLFRKWLWWWPVRTIRDLSNPDEAQTDLWPGRLKAKIYPAGSYDSVFESPRLPFYPNESTIVYAIGSLADGTFDLLVQKIPLPRRHGWEGFDDFHGDGDDLARRVSDTLSLEEYDRLAAEHEIDREAETVDVR
jgi:hypothetical protein